MTATVIHMADFWNRRMGLIHLLPVVFRTRVLLTASSLPCLGLSTRIRDQRIRVHTVMVMSNHVPQLLLRRKGILQVLLDICPGDPVISQVGPAKNIDPRDDFHMRRPPLATKEWDLA